MPPALKRIYGRDDLHFATFSCYRRQPFLRTPGARNIFVSRLAKLREYYSFRLIGYVVMPEHVHMLISETPALCPSSVLQVLKRNVASDLKDQIEDHPRFWERRFYDFNVYSASKRREKLDYMHLNPYKRGLVQHPRDWPWSSFLNYQDGKTGLIPIDYA